jgi:integrase/recombinase XerD
VKEQLAQFLAYLRFECGLSHNTILAYRRDITQLFETLAGRGIRDLEGLDAVILADHFRNRLTDGLAPRSVARAISAVRMFLRFLVVEGVLAQNVARWIETPKTWQRLPCVLNEREVDRLLACPLSVEVPFRQRDHAILETFYAAGARVSEVCSLRTSELRLDVGIVRITGKGGRERIVPLHRKAVDAIQTYQELERPLILGARDDPGFLFLSQRGRRLDRASVWRLVKRYARLAGIVLRMTPHVFRHSFATHLLTHGADLRVVQELLGHARVETTEIYTHLDRRDLKRAHRKYHPRP